MNLMFGLCDVDSRMNLMFGLCDVDSRMNLMFGLVSREDAGVGSSML